MRTGKTTFARARRLRREMSLPEVLLWQHLRGAQLAGLRFRRQHPVGTYILDFYCADHRLCIEIDGSAHDSPERAAHDARREVWLNSQGIRVIRFAASDILNKRHFEAVIRGIAASVAPSTAVPAVPLPRDAGEDQ